MPYTGPAEPAAFSVLIRRDYAVVEPARLVAQAERVAAHDRDAEFVNDGGSAEALGVLFGEYEPDEIASRYKDFGLEEGDSTLWIAASEEGAEPGEWLGSPFGHIDPQDVLHRFDVSSVFDEEHDEFDEDEEEAAAPGLTPA